jgi:hypothetical protein
MTTVTLAGLPPNTVKADILPVLQRFGEVKRIFVQPNGRRADFVFAGVYGVKRTFRAYAQKPFCIVFRKYAKLDKVSGMDTDTSS